MKKLAIIAAMLLPVLARAQSAADPNAIDFSGRMDTLSPIQPSWHAASNFDAGILNANPFEDFYIGIDQDSWSPLRYGGPFIYNQTSYSSILRLPEILGDFTGTGRKDIIDNRPEYHKRIVDSAYFDSLGTTWFTVHGRFPAFAIFGAADCNHDGINDLVAYAGAEEGFNNGIVIYYGSPHIADSTFKYPDDSLPNIEAFDGVVGTFNKPGNPLLFLGVSTTTPDTPHVTTYKIGVLRHLNDLAHDSVVYLSHTTNDAMYNPGDSMIAVKGMYAMDITGDGITDLLVTDDWRIWIFKGSDSLGYYPLTKSRGYYSIPSPRLIGWNDTRFDYVTHFGEYMHACGDLTGSGIPYLMVCASPDPSSSLSLIANALFYAGGKALDTLYDAIVSIENENLGFMMDTLHSIDNSGRSAVLLMDNIDYNAVQDLDLLLYKDADKIPHKTNTSLFVAPAFPIMYDSLRVITGNNYVKLNAVVGETEESTLAVYNILGQQIYSKEEPLDPGDNIINIDAHQWPSGIYFAIVTGQRGSMAAKFFVQKSGGLTGFAAMQQRAVLRNFQLIKLGPEENR